MMDYTAYPYNLGRYRCLYGKIYFRVCWTLPYRCINQHKYAPLAAINEVNELDAVDRGICPLCMTRPLAKPRSYWPKGQTCKLCDQCISVVFAGEN